MSNVDRFDDAKRRARGMSVIDGGGGGNDIDPMEARVASLETSVKELKVGVDALRHNQTIFLTAIVFVVSATLVVAGYFSTTALSELRAMNQRFDRFIERPAPLQPTPQIIVLPAPPTAPTK